MLLGTLRHSCQLFVWIHSFVRTKLDLLSRILILKKNDLSDSSSLPCSRQGPGGIRFIAHEKVKLSRLACSQPFSVQEPLNTFGIPGFDREKLPAQNT
jgi:hypothetical protein